MTTASLRFRTFTDQAHLALQKIQTAVALLPPQDPLGLELKTTEAHHKPRRSVLFAPFAETYSRIRDQHLYDNPFSRQRITPNLQSALRGYRFLGIPGVLNFSFGHSTLELWAHAFEFGGAMMSISDNPVGSNRGTYQVLGGLEAVFHENFRVEMGTLIERIYFDLLQQNQSHHDFRYVLLGHSKGGLLAKELRLLALIFMNLGHVPEKLTKLYPGLEKVHPQKQKFVFEIIAESHAFSILSPLEGLDDRTKKIARYSLVFDLLFPGLARGFYEDHVHQVKKHHDNGYDISQLLSGVIYADRQRGGLLSTLYRQLNSDDSKLDSSPSKDLYHRFVDGLFDVIGAVTTPLGHGDGIVPTPREPAHRNDLRLKGHHLSVVETEAHAHSILDFVASVLQREPEPNPLKIAS